MKSGFRLPGVVRLVRLDLTLDIYEHRPWCGNRCLFSSKKRCLCLCIIICPWNEIIGEYLRPDDYLTTYIFWLLKIFKYYVQLNCNDLFTNSPKYHLNQSINYSFIFIFNESIYSNTSIIAKYSELCLRIFKDMIIVLAYILLFFFSNLIIITEDNKHLICAKRALE